MDSSTYACNTQCFKISQKSHFWLWSTHFRSILIKIYCCMFEIPKWDIFDDFQTVCIRERIFALSLVKVSHSLVSFLAIETYCPLDGFFSSTIDKWALCTHTGKKPKRDMSRMLIFLKMTFFQKQLETCLKSWRIFTSRN